MRDQNHNKPDHPPIRRGRKWLLWLGGTLAVLLVLMIVGWIYELLA